jgi:hypothetical protein
MWSRDFIYGRNDMAKKNKVVQSSTWSAALLLLVGLCIWPGLTVHAFAAGGSCAASAEGRQFDFWLGDWTIAAPGGSSSSTSKVSLSLDQCLLVEKWDGGKGHAGENMFAYSPDDKSWYGMFADNMGRAHVFTGGHVASGVAEFDGTNRGPKGETVLDKVKVVRIAPNKVEQTWEKSTDNGATWIMVFRGEYTRANP